VARTLILDAEAIHALARARERGALAERARAILQVAREEGGVVRVPAPVLAEVCRGGAFDAPVNRLLNGRGIGVVELTGAVARRAGRLLARAGLGSAHAIDAFVVATALELGLAVIATGDPDDLARLAKGAPGLRIFAI
jgi:predicted nucleic acid-binding protein